MGFLNIFAKTVKPLLALPQVYPSAFVEGIGREVVAAFQSAQAAQTPFYEIIIRYANLKLTARELRGGAIIFLAPQTFSSKTS